MPMRIIGGFHRSRKLVYPEDNPSIRPTKDRIREALFSILGDVSNKSFLDLYAGSGSIGLEAISRGASKAYFVDQNIESIKYVKTNIESLKEEDKCEVYKSLDLDVLEQFKNRNIKFDIIYFDPPYLSDRYEKVVPYIFNEELLEDFGVMAIEVNHELDLSDIPNVKIKEYHYGEILLYIIRKNY